MTRMVSPMRLILMMIMMGCQIVKMPSQKIQRNNLIPMVMVLGITKTKMTIMTDTQMSMKYCKVQIRKTLMKVHWIATTTVSQTF